MRNNKKITLTIGVGQELVEYKFNRVFDMMEYIRQCKCDNGAWALLMYDKSIHNSKSQGAEIMQIDENNLLKVFRCIRSAPAHFNYFVFFFNSREDAQMILDDYTEELGLGKLCMN